MRVLITGASGNIGSAVRAALADEPQVTAIVGVARRPPADRRDGTTWVAADVATDDLGPACAGADALVHLAWAFHPARDERRTWRVNVLGTIRTVQAALAAGVRTIVYASSVGAYSPAVDDRPVDEGWPTHALPTAAYGRQKSYLERVFDTLELRHPEVRFVRLRTAFVFQRQAASEQRRIFAGPFVPTRLLRPGALPLLPVPAGLRLQAVHARDAAAAYRAALLSPVSGAFNIAAEPVLDGARLARLLHARPVRVPDRLTRAALALAFHARLVPAEPGLLELALSLPTMSTTRARERLGWQPTVGAEEAVAELLSGVRDGAGGPTPTLAPHAGGPARTGELATGVGARA